MSILFGSAADRARLERIVTDLVGEVAILRERVATLEEGRSAAERLAGEVRGLGQRLDGELEKFGALARRIVALDRKVEESEKRGEVQRRKLVALAKSVDWEMDSLRKSLDVLFSQSLVRGEPSVDASPSAGPLPPTAVA